MSNASLDIHRPYLVIPKLILQPTWGGTYIAMTKGWSKKPDLQGMKIGQSYELFSGSNLSLLDSSLDPAFEGELTDNLAVSQATHPDGSVSLRDLVARDPTAVLGEETVAERGEKMNVLIKFTQALGNSFQIHIPSDQTHPRLMRKPESWYYFEPGLITLGVKPDADWGAYEHCLRTIDEAITSIGSEVKANSLSYDEALIRIARLFRDNNPWQFVNTVATKAGDVVDLSKGGLHHSWEENGSSTPHGNVLLELQQEALDDVSTLRSFDRGKLMPDGSKRPLQIDDYFELIDRRPEENAPETHFRQPTVIANGDNWKQTALLRTPYYNLDSLVLTDHAVYQHQPSRFQHIFVRSGQIDVAVGSRTLTVSQGHSCLIPAACGSYTLTNKSDITQLLISY